MNNKDEFEELDLAFKKLVSDIKKEKPYKFIEKLVKWLEEKLK